VATEYGEGGKPLRKKAFGVICCRAGGNWGGREPETSRFTSDPRGWRALRRAWYVVIGHGVWCRCGALSPFRSKDSTL